jgi:hypothetical protein
MRRIIEAFILGAVMSREVIAYDPYSTMEDEWNRKRQLSEIQQIEQDARHRQMEIDDRLMQLERQERIERRENEWRMRQLEGERYRSEWR